MMNRLKAVVVAATLALPQPIHAADEDGGFVVRGMGVVSCGDLVDALRVPEPDMVRIRFVAWLSGYITHASRVHPTQHDVLPFADVESFATIVARICDANRDARVEAATHRVLELLAPLNADEAETAELAEHNGVRFWIRPSVLEAVQHDLIARGLLADGQADGVFGPATAAAIASFQQGIGLEQTGLPDAWTLFQLRANP